ncbi:4-azaleucine resistance transporter AzlC [Hydrogenispora ethanolica]|uniref:4-azaleucine resistance transporter AzlC n=1 Tax=Hydrogenispora ethanolica TaxID=1082276 RepID=A0A4R1RAX4_HYDET|nr:AzlC family ABC transporter permease [Hydrogenispora ethanolica]TCL62760.1 4-azaleucine resistance transporter AzlC [Hydrogenispora ethanolica]
MSKESSAPGLHAGDGFRTGFPILVGYFPIAIAFGLLAKSATLTFGGSLSFSVFVFAGASQFMALNLLKTGVAIGEIIIATLLLNFRHLLMSASLAARLEGRNRRFLPLVAFGVTDETFAVAATQEGGLTIPYLLALEVTAYSGWVSGTAVGYLIGGILPPLVQASLGIGLYAMFVALLIPQCKKARSIAALALGAGLINALLGMANLLSGGWNLVAAMLIAACLGAAFRKEDEMEEERA